MRTLLFTAALLLPSAAIAQVATTPTGQPEGTFEHTTLADATGKVAGACMDKGWSVTAQTSNQITCQIPFSGFKQALAGFLLGNSYSTPPNVYAQFSLAQIGDGVRAQARAWVETQMAFGQTRQAPYDDAKSKTALMAFLSTAGASLPNGTTFSGPYIGMEDTKTDTNVINVSHVYHHTPGEAAGLRAGDQLFAVDGKSFKSVAEFQKHIEKVKGATYTLSVYRGGQTIVLTILNQQRPAVGTPEYQSVVDEVKQYRAQQGRQ